jgi:hypothetical protein
LVQIYLENIPNDHKLYPTAFNYTKCLKYSKWS